MINFLERRRKEKMDERNRAIWKAVDYICVNGMDQNIVDYMNRYGLHMWEVDEGVKKRESVLEQQIGGEYAEADR